MFRSVVAVALILAPAAPAAAQRKIVYDYATGVITLVFEGGEIAFTLHSDTAQIRLLPAFGPCNRGGFSHGTSDSPNVTWANFGGFDAGACDAGQIVHAMTDPATLTATAALDFVESAPLPIETIHLPVPEPGAAVLGIGGVCGGLLCFRRRSATGSSDTETWRQEKLPPSLPSCGMLTVVGKRSRRSVGWNDVMKLLRSTTPVL